MQSSHPSTIRKAAGLLLLVSLAGLPLAGCGDDGNPAQNSIAIPKDVRSNTPGNEASPTKKGGVMKGVKEVATQAREKNENASGTAPSP